jgi:hypothetical protein
MKPLGQSAIPLEPEKAPSQLNHAAPDASAAGTRKTPFAPASAALDRRAGEAGEAGDGSAIAQVAREDLINLHIRRLDAHAEHPPNEANHRVRAFVPSRGCRELAQAFLLDRVDLLAHDA